LRAIAVVLVLLEHAGVSLISGGFVGVDVFFVLSGFLITGLLIRELESTNRISLLQFYARRARRLLPASTLVLVVTIIASYLWIGGTRADRVAEDGIWAALFASNFRFIELGTDYLNARLPPSPLQHFWSLAVEEQFYAVWPLVMFGIARLRRRVPLRIVLGIALTAIIVASMIWSDRQTAVDATEAYFSPFTRAYELAIGGVLAVAAPWIMRLPAKLGAAMTWLGIAVILYTAVTFDASTHFPGLAALIPVIGASLVVAGGSTAGSLGAESLLKLAPFQYIGKLSYSIYLWHWPLLVIVAAWAGRDLTVAEALGLCVIAVAAAQMSYLVVENPVRNAPVLKRATPLVSIGVGVALIVVSVGVANLYLTTQRTPGEITSDDVTIATYPDQAGVLAAVQAATTVSDWPEQPSRIANLAYSKDCDVTRADTTSSECVFGDPNGTTTIALFGDSHAAMWVPTLDVIGKQAGIKVIQFTKPGCPPMDFPVYSNALGREYTECAAFLDWAIERIPQVQPDVILMTGAFRGMQQAVNGSPTTDGIEDAWMSGLTSVIETLKPSTKRIVVIGDMAYPSQGGIDCLTANAGDAQACADPRASAFDDAHNDRERETAIAAGAEFVDISSWFCTDTTCPPVIGGLTVHRDSFHTGENYAVYLSQAFADATGIVPDGTRIRASTPEPTPAS